MSKLAGFFFRVTMTHADGMADVGLCLSTQTFKCDDE